MNRPLRAEPLTAAAFEPFGSVIQTEGNTCHPINDGTTDRYHRLAVASALPVAGESPSSARVIISLFEARPCVLPAAIETMERHPLGSQAFMPLDPRPWLIVVAPPGSSPQPGDLRAFVATSRQGINYAAGVWHHPLLVLNGVSRFLVVDREGEGSNCDAISLGESVSVDLQQGVHHD